ncbi:MAG TPA: hypothetical protein VKU61_00380 [Candidatus Binatia bacterium]|nr:hypothetical protein [Candidatus Binatia bacterium]
MPPAAPEPPPEPAAAATPPPEPPQPPAERIVATRLPDGAPSVEINVLVYSRVPSHRTVTLTVGSSGMMTLHEGETTGEVVVERIFPDHVELRHQGRLFAVKTNE